MNGHKKRFFSPLGSQSLSGATPLAVGLIVLGALVTSSPAGASPFKFSPDDAEVSVATVALSDAVAPGTTSTFLNFSTPRINDRGEVSFAGLLTDPVRYGVWMSDTDGALEVVVLEMEEAPGLAPARIGFLATDFRFSNLGPVFWSRLEHGGNVTSANDEVIFGPVDAAGATGVVARSDDPVPGGSGLTYLGLSSMSEHLQGSEGGVAFVCDVTGSNVALFRFHPDSGVDLHAMEGDPAPDLPGLICDGIDSVLINDQGRVLYRGSLVWGVGGVNGDNDTVYWATDEMGDDRVLVRTGGPAPGTDAVFTYLTWYREELGFNDAGELAFWASLDNGGWGVWGPDGAGGLRVLALHGDLAPGADGALFDDFLELTMNAAGTVVFTADLQGGGMGLWSVRVGEAPRLVMLRGGPSPIPGWTVSGVITSWEVNGADQVVLPLVISDGISTEVTLWVFDLSNAMWKLLLRTGDVLEVAPGDHRTLTSMSLSTSRSGGEDGKGKGFNDAAQVAAVLSFTDGSKGVFRIDAMIPLFADGFEAGDTSAWSSTAP